MEVETTHLIRKKTTIPVPQIHTWGLVETNPLGLSPFILVEFIDGIYLKDCFCGRNQGYSNKRCRIAL